MDNHNMALLLDQVVDEYGRPDRLRMKNKADVQRKINEMQRQGHQTLQVIADFDFTITKFADFDGVRCVSCHGILDNSPLLPDSFRDLTLSLLKKYYPMEIDPSISVEEKIPHMVDWYETAHSALVKVGLKRSDLENIVKTSRAILRDNVKDAFHLLNNYNIPCLIFSGGIGNLLELVLRRDQVLYPNMHIISNMMIFNEKDEIIGFEKPLVHMFNKNEATVVHSSYFENLKKRSNVILLGDSFGDVQMSKGVPNPNAVLKIGFLNDKIDERLDAFLDIYDIVILNDQSFDFVNALLKHVLNVNPEKKD